MGVIVLDLYTRVFTNILIFNVPTAKVRRWLIGAIVLDPYQGFHEHLGIYVILKLQEETASTAMTVSDESVA